MNFDDINFSALTESERQEILKLWRDDKYGFYARWKNPAQVQEKMIAWQRETMPGYTERPADWVFEKIGELKAAGAPQSVVDYYVVALHRPDEYNSSVPNKKVMSLADKFFKEEYEDTNWEAEPEVYSSSDDYNPISQKYVDIIQGVYNLPTKRTNAMRRYREFGTLNEIIEMRPGDSSAEHGIANMPNVSVTVFVDESKLRNELVVRYRFKDAYKMP